MSEPGRIDLRVEDDSMFLTNNLPYVIRNAWHSVVASGTAQQGVNKQLSEGLYSVEVITPRGQEQTALVHVTAGERTPLVVTADGVRVDTPTSPLPTITEAADEPPEAIPAAATLVETSGSTLRSQDEKGWIFLPQEPLTEVPVATFELGDARWEISLPLNPEGAEPEQRQCRVRVEDSAVVPRLEVAIGGRRRVFRMLVGMLRENGVAGGTELLDTAAGLLLTKYSDPVAAALGGLTLHRFGRLQERQSWVENLSRDFGWLRDGRILCAALLQKDRDSAERDRGLDLLLEATDGRPVYTDGLSLALELLRRWPGDARVEERTDRLEGLANYSAGADWESIALTTTVGE
jgi:hypothetical protein